MDFIYDKSGLLGIMNDFYILTGIRIVLYDNGFNIIACVPDKDCEFCITLRENAVARSRCDTCALNAIKIAKEKGALNIYKCHAGLVEAVAPIKVGGIIVGYMMLGQLLEKDSNVKEITGYASLYADKKIAPLADKLLRKSRFEIKSAAKIMESCVCYLLMNGVIKEGAGDTAFKLSRYINENLSGDLSVNTLCREFKISRNKLYRISDAFFGMPFAKYVKLKRIEKSAELIKEGVSVTLAAELAGFCDYGYYGKIFKAVTGKTPTQIKNN